MAFFLLSLSRWLSAQGSKCGVLQWTGYYCPGCGGTRCANDLVHGQLLAAFGHNALLTSGALLFSAGCLFLIVRMTLLGKPAPTINPSSRWIWVILTTILLFTILRNLERFSFLAP